MATQRAYGARKNRVNNIPFETNIRDMFLALQRT